MRLSNRTKAPVYNFINSLAILGIVAGIFAFLFERYKYDILGWESIFLIIIPVLFAVYIYFRGRQIFEYDSDGEALNFKNRNVTPLLGETASDEFPKYKVQKYEFVNILGIKKLFVTINSKKNHHTTLKYDVSYLTGKEIGDLKISLNKVIKANKENKQIN